MTPPGDGAAGWHLDASLTWITVAGAMQRRATVVDYIRAHHSKVGLAFAYWPGAEASETGWAEAEAMIRERY